jgi:hypothetical protein
MENELDRLLLTPLLTPPPDFTARVMRRVEHLPVPQHASRWQQAWQWLALAAAGIPAILQLLAFMFAMWAATTAG